MKFLLPIFIGLFVLGGCTVNHAKLNHDMNFALIEDTAQNSIRKGMSQKTVNKIATDEWGLTGGASNQTSDLELVYVLKPKTHSYFARTVPQSLLTFEFNVHQLSTLTYSNYWLDGSMHGEHEITLMENH